MVYYNISHLKDDHGTEIADKDVVMTSGCYDIFHLGHVCMLEFCAKLGDLVIVVVNGDQSAKELKGKHRPIQPSAFRAGVVEACGYVDHVLVWESSDIIPVIHQLEPRFWVKGQRKFDDVLETDAVFHHGGDVICYWNHLESISTTQIVGRIIAADHAEQELKDMRSGDYLIRHAGEFRPGARFPIEVDVALISPGDLRQVADAMEGLMSEHPGSPIWVSKKGYNFQWKPAVLNAEVPEPARVDLDLSKYDIGVDKAEEGSSDEQVQWLQIPVTPQQLRVAAYNLEQQMDDRTVARFYLGGVEFSYSRGGKLDNGSGDDELPGGETDEDTRREAGDPGDGQTPAGEDKDNDVPF